MQHNITIVTLIENNPITGVKYGTVEINLSDDNTKYYNTATKNVMNTKRKKYLYNRTKYRNG